MKPNFEIKPVKKAGVLSTTKCRIAANPFAFKMLARQYSDPPKAILQEVSANAADSHIRAGKEDVPFEVKLPNRIDPHLRIRDYGISMSPQKLEEVYVELMASDKRGDNDETGLFGIGSKSPLSYCDSFNITTYLDGVMRMYTLCYGDDGIPELNHCGEWETSEATGLEISFAVKEGDWSKFHVAAKHVYSFYKVKPIVDGIENFAANTYKASLLEGEDGDWKLIGDNASYVIMGNIGYKIDPYQFSYSYWDNNAPRRLINRGIHFNVEVGDLDPTPSREGLEYNSKTIAAITEKIKGITAELGVFCSKKVEKAHSEWEANLLAGEIKYQLGGSIEPDYSSCKWSITPNIDVSDNLYKYRETYGKCRREGFARTRSVSRKEMILVIKDIDKTWDTRCRKYVRDTSNDIYLFEGTSKDELMKKYGIIPADNVVFNVSELEKPVANKSAGKGRRGPRTTIKSVKRFDKNGTASHRNYDMRKWPHADIDYAKGEYVYVMIDQCNIMLEKRRSWNFASDAACAKNSGIYSGSIYGLDSSTKHLAKRKNWTPLYEVLDTELKKYVTKEFLNERSVDNAFNDSDYYEALEAFGRHTLPAWTDKKNPLAKLIELASGNSEFRKKNAGITRVCEIVGYTLDTAKSDSTVLDLEAKAIALYPLIMDYIVQFSSYHVDQKRVNWVVETVNKLGS